MDALTLDYTVKFPLSLVISRRSITFYQLLFRHLLQLTHLEGELTSVWAFQKGSLWKSTGVPASIALGKTDRELNALRRVYHSLDQFKSRTFALRSRMFYYVQQLFSFIVSEVLEVNARVLENKLEKVTTVDQLLRDHKDFLETCLKECLLTNEQLLVVSPLFFSGGYTESVAD